MLFADWLGNFYFMLIRAARIHAVTSQQTARGGPPGCRAMHPPPPVAGDAPPPPGCRRCTPPVAAADAPPPPRLPPMHPPPGCRRCTPPVAGDAPPPPPRLPAMHPPRLPVIHLRRYFVVKYNQALARFFLGGRHVCRGSEPKQSSVCVTS